MIFFKMSRCMVTRANSLRSCWISRRHLLGALRQRSIHRFVGRTIPPRPIPHVPNFDPEFLGHLLSSFVSVTPMVDYRALKLFAVNFRLFGPVPFFSWFIFSFSQTQETVSSFSGEGLHAVWLIHSDKRMRARFSADDESYRAL